MLTLLRSGGLQIVEQIAMCKNLDELCISVKFGTRIGGVIRIFLEIVTSLI